MVWDDTAVPPDLTSIGLSTLCQTLGKGVPCRPRSCPLESVRPSASLLSFKKADGEGVRGVASYGSGCETRVGFAITSRAPSHFTDNILSKWPLKMKFYSHLDQITLIPLGHNFFVALWQQTDGRTGGLRNNGISFFLPPHFPWDIGMERKRGRSE